MVPASAMSVSIKQLREFVAVAEARSITRAAQALYVAQPALSLQVKRLESELGVQLFVRLPRGVELTEEGAELLELARRAVRDADAFVRRARELREHVPQHLDIGFMAHGAGDMTPEILRAFRSRHPGVRVTFRQFGFDDSFVGVTAGLVDAGFVSGPVDVPDGGEMRLLRSDPIVAAVAADHPIASRSSVSIREVVAEPFVTDDQPAGRWHDYWLAMHHRPPGPADVAARTFSHDEWLEAVRAGVGVSICPDITARYYPRPGVAFVPVPDMEPAPFYVAWMRDRAGPLVQDFVACAVRAAERYADTANADDHGVDECVVENDTL
jgi:DNA-binding transcriptional LysR family regulator